MDDPPPRARRRASVSCTSVCARSSRGVRLLCGIGSDWRSCLCLVREDDPLDAPTIPRDARKNKVDSTCSRRPAGGNSRLVCSSGIRRWLYVRWRCTERTYGVPAYGASGCAEGTRDDVIVCIWQRRRHFRTEPFHWCDDGRSSRKPGACRPTAIHRESRSLRVGRDGDSIRRYCSCPSHISNHDFRNDTRLFHHRPAYDFQSRELLHLVSVTTATDLRSACAARRCSPAEPKYSQN